MKTMWIDGVEYAEAPETNLCTGCAFKAAGNLACAEATRAGAIAFGEDCCDRSVIYVRAADAKPSAAMAELLKARDAINAAIAALEAA
jgi:hypothetical protein